MGRRDAGKGHLRGIASAAVLSRATITTSPKTSRSNSATTRWASRPSMPRNTPAAFTIERRSNILKPVRWLANLPRTPEFSVVVFSFLLNLVWEIWQVPLFRGMADQPHWLGVKACTQATLGDSGIALAAFWVTAICARNRGWILEPRKADIAIFIGAGIVATLFLEALATGVLDRWAYSDNMPRLPVLGTGLLPVIQWLVLPPLVVWFVRRQIGTRAPKCQGREEACG